MLYNETAEIEELTIPTAYGSVKVSYIDSLGTRIVTKTVQVGLALCVDAIYNILSDLTPDLEVVMYS